MKHPYIGQTITSTRKLKRSNTYTGAKSTAKWERIDWKLGDYIGQYIGYRTYSNGTLIYNYEDGTEYKPTEYFEIWLMVTDERKNPIAVLPADCTLHDKVA
jgi:hypothetical protein